MQSGGCQQRFELELSKGGEGLRFDCQRFVSGGTLLEWLVAIRQHLRATDPANPIRLDHVGWWPQRHDRDAPRIVCEAREHSALVTIGDPDARRLAVRAEWSDAAALAATPAPPWFVPETRETVIDQAFYAELERLGLEVDREARGVERARLGSEGLQAWLSAGLDAEGFLVGPRALDAALHCALLFARRRLGRAISVWPAIERVSVLRPGARPRSLALRERAGGTEETVVLDVVLFDAPGNEVARLDGVFVGTAAAAEARAYGDLVAAFSEIVRACVPVRELATDTPFPALGVTSIDLVRISAYAEECLGWSPTLAEFVASPTIEGLAELYRADGLSRPTPELEPVADAQALSSTERQLWFLELLTNAAGSYNEGFAWRIRGPLAIDALERALQLVQRKHAALHSYFPGRDGVPERRLDWRQCTLELVVTPDTVRDSPEQLQEWIDGVVRRPFDLEHAPPFRCVLLLHAAGEATLVLAVHHIACDAWSFARVLVPELGAAYAALLENPGAAPPGWEDARPEIARREPDAEYVRAAEVHFRQQLGPLPHVLDFPFDHPRPAQQSHRGACLRRPLGAARWSALKSLARELEVSPFVLCLAIYQLLLSRYTRQPEFCLGVPVSLRRGGRDERVFGCRVNLSVLAARIEPQHDFRSHCSRVRAGLIDMLRFDQLALGDVVRAVAPARSLSHTPLVQAVFGYRELAGADLALAGAEVSPRFAHNRCAKFDLALAIDDFGEEADASLEYATDLLEPGSAARLLAHFEALLDDVLRRPELPVGQLSLSSESERAFIAASECGPLQPTAAIGSLGLALLRSRAAESVALSTAGTTWRTTELKRAVCRVVTALRDAQVQPGEFVAICIPRSPEWVAAVLAVLELGAAYAPFDPAQPLARIEHGIARSGAQVVLTWCGAYPASGGGGRRVIDLRALLQPADGQAAAVVPIAHGSHPVGESASAARPVYGIMTSGSTGLPRVAAVSQAGFSNLLDWYRAALQLTAADRVVLATSIGFDLTQKNVFAALAAGAELVIDDSGQLDPVRLLELIERRAVTVLNCTPSLAYALVASAAARDLRMLRSLRVLVLGGEPIDQLRMREWTSHPSCRARILNSYGPTECSDVVTACTLHEGGGSDIGTPIPNARCRVVDSGGGVAALGVPGELLLSGVPVGLGYLDDPTATAAKFVRVDGVTWYRTGDLVRRGEAGELRYLGRLDTQVKIRGYRIELTEIEAALEQQPDVEDAIVLARPDPLGRPALVAYVVPSAAVSSEVLGAAAGLSGLSGDADGPSGEFVLPRGELIARQRELAIRLRERLARDLPSYMIPSVILPIERVPRTPSGKLDRNALPAPRSTQVARLEVDRGLVAQLAEACCAVLGVSSLSADADFFEHGGHSLAAIELVSRLQTELGIPLRVSALFERPVLRDYAAYLAECLERGEAERAGEAEPRSLRVVTSGTQV